METNNSVKDAVLDKIAKSEVQMHSRAYFALKLSLFVALIVAILAVSVFIFNFIAFSIRINHHDALLGFGSNGLLLFLWFFPWWLLLIDAALIAILQALIRQFEFGYKIPVLRLVGGVLLVALIMGFVMDATRVNERFLHDADAHRTPSPFDHFYQGARYIPPSDGPVHRGLITEIAGGHLVVRDLSATTSTYSVFLPHSLGASTSIFKVGDTIFFAGHFRQDGFEAFGVQVVSPE